MSKNLVYFGFAMSVILLWLVVRKIDLARTVHTVLAINGRYFVLSLSFFLLTIYFRSVRWRYLLEARPPVPLPALFSATSIGLMVNNIFPVRMGDVARAYLIGKKAKVSAVTAVATLAVERIVDVLCLLSILGLYLRVTHGEQIQQAGLRIGKLGLAFLGLLAGGIVAVYVASARHRWMEDFVGRTLGRRFPQVSNEVLKLFSKAVAGFTAVRDWAQLLRVVLFTLCLWLAGATSYFYLMRSFSFPLGFTSGLLVLVFVTFGVAFPSAPGYVGTYHAACILGLAFVGLQNQSLAVSYAFTLHAMEWTSSTALGFFFLWREGLSLKTIRVRA